MTTEQNFIKQKARPTPRPPVVVLLGHVDAGKTTLLDTIAGSKFVASEFGEITQSVRAIEVETQFGQITFIDTPGHSYFSNLRHKGAKLADIALLVVSAVEGIREQTIESVKLAKLSTLPLICVISKIDLPQVNPVKIKTRLAESGILKEEVPLIEVSAVKKIGIDNLIETISILATFQDLKANLDFPTKAVVLESSLDKKTGPVAFVIVKEGILKVGAQIKVDRSFGKVRAIFDQNGLSIPAAIPTQPVKILGLGQVVEAGSVLEENGFSETTQVADLPKTPSFSDRELARKQLPIILKADSFGSKEAVLRNLPKNVTILEAGVGQVTAGDVEKAVVFKGKIFGFNVGLTPDATKILGEKDQDFFSSRLIYELIDKIAEIADKSQVKSEKVIGAAKILKSFNIDGNKIAGCKVLAGFLEVGKKVRVFRGEKEIGVVQIASMKQYDKVIVRADTGCECGIGFAAPIDFAIGDVIKFVV